MSVYSMSTFSAASGISSKPHLTHLRYANVKCRIERQALEKSFNSVMNSLNSDKSRKTRKNSIVVVPMASIDSDDDENSYFDLPLPKIPVASPSKNSPNNTASPQNHVYRSPIFDPPSALASPSSKRGSPFKHHSSMSGSPQIQSPKSRETTYYYPELSFDEADLVFNEFSSSLNSLKNELEEIRKSYSPPAQK